MRCDGLERWAFAVGLALARDVLADIVCEPFTPTSIPKFTASRTTSFSTNVAGAGQLILGLGSAAARLEGNHTTSEITAPFNPAITDCQGALADWSSTTSKVKSPYLGTFTTTLTYDFNYTLTKGSACVDATENGFAHAVGVFQSAVTTVSNSPIINVAKVDWLPMTPSSLLNASIPPRPGCTINIESCSSLWNTFRSSLGITATPADWFGSMFGTAPGYSSPTPPPRNFPRCTQISAGCSTNAAPEQCRITGENVQIYYWPDQTSSHSRNITRHASSSGPRTQVVDGITMTSPSIYLSFDYLAALATSNRDVLCYGTQPLNNLTLTGAYIITQVGDALTNALFSLAPQSVSTLEVGWYTGSASASSTYGPFPDAAISAIAGTNQTAYNYWIKQIVQGGGYYNPIASVLRPSDLVRPNPRAYYLRPRDNNEMPINCLPDGPRGGCNTIYDNQYQAQLSIPSQIIKMQPAWSACVPGIHGIYDPPKALTGADDPVEVTVTSQTSSTTTSASPQSPIADATVTSTEAPRAQATTTSSVVKQANQPPVAPSSSPTKDGSSGEKAPSSAAAQDPGVASPQVKSSTTSSAFSPQTIAFTTKSGSQQDPSNALQALSQAAKLTSVAVPVAMITAGSTTITASSISGNVVLGTTTISPGQAATVNGATISNAGSAVIVQPAAPSMTDAAGNHVGSYIANGLGIDPPKTAGSSEAVPKSTTAGSAAPSRAVYRGQGSTDAGRGSLLLYLLSSSWLLAALV